MGQRATVYTVKVHEKGKPKEPLDFGDIDGHGTHLADELNKLFGDNFRAASTRDEKEVVCEATAITADQRDLQLTLLHGESGHIQDIHGPNGQLRLRQKLEDTALVRCGSLFRLPLDQPLGFWVVHSNNGRHTKGLVHAELMQRFNDRFDELRLKVEPCVLGSVLDEAIAHDQIESVKLVKYDASPDVAEVRRWVPNDAHAKIELRISAVERGRRLLGDLAAGALANDANSWGQIVEFKGVHFDEAKVEVVLGGGTRRTYDIQDRESGHPFAAEIEIEFDAAGPIMTSVFEELGNVLTEME